MATYVKFNQFVEYAFEGVFNLGSDTLRLALTDTAPTASTDTVFLSGSLHPPPAATNGYTSGGNTLTISSSAQTSGTYKLVLADSVFTASGGSLGPFRYAIMYDDTPSSPADPLISYWDYGSSITLLTTETFTADFDSGTGVLTLA